MPLLKRTLITVLVSALLLVINTEALFAVSLPFRLVWERNSEADLAFYTVYYGTVSRKYDYFADVDKQYPYHIVSRDSLAADGITIGPNGLNLYIALTATDFSLNESGYSRELSVHIDPSSVTTSTPVTTTISPATTTVSAPATTKIFIEAEDGIISSPMETAEDGAASLGSYVLIPNGNGNTMDPEVESGYAEYVFAVPTTGDYIVWGRVISTNADDDSFFASLDNGGYALWDTAMEATDVWMWDQISDRGFADPVIFHLEAGMHSLIIKQREDGTKLDKILITNDMNYVPTGEGGDNTTTAIPTGGTQKEYCSPDPTLILHGSIPEEGTMTVTIQGNFANAISAALSLTLFDPDISGEGHMYINGNGPMNLPVGDFDNLEHTFEVPININWLVQGDNSIRFTHDDTWGYEVRELCIRVLSPGSTTPSVPLPRPTTTTSIKPDETPPAGSVIIQQGSKITNSRLVTLNLSAEDDESGVGTGAQMMLSNDNQEWFGPKPFAPTKLWVLTPGEGDKRVYAKFSDEAGNWMDEPANDSIEFQLSCPKPLQMDATALECSGCFSPAVSEEKTVDGKTHTGWLSPLRISPQEEYITIDLGETRVVNRIDISSNLFLFLNLFPRAFKLQGSTDNYSWVDLFAVTDYSPPLSRTDSWVFDETEARYIKVVTTEGKRFMFFFRASYIAEIKAYGCAEPEIEAPELLSTKAPDQTGKYEEQQTLDAQTAGKQQLQPGTGLPGRPGKPVFILEGKP